ncbi:hypothetical protein JCM10213_001554 [Rhodosporidiobolus nylandii]
MLDRPPLELVDHVVRLALPQPFSFRQYRDRQDTLLALCRTSKVMRTVAQPLLFEVVELKSADEVEGFVEACEATKLGGRVKQLRLAYSLGVIELSPVAEVASLAACCPRLSELFLHGVDVDFACLQPFENLRTLVVSNSNIPYTANFLLPSVKELSLVFTAFHERHLSSSLYPSLKALHFQHNEACFLGRKDFEPLLRDVEAVSCDLQDLDLEAESSAPCENFLPDWTPWASGYRRLEAPGLCATVTALENGPAPHLATLYLSTSFSGHSPELDAALSLLRDACATRSIEVVDEPPFHPLYGSLVSREFWRRCKALKAEGEGEKEGKAGRE